MIMTADAMKQLKILLLLLISQYIKKNKAYITKMKTGNNIISIILENIGCVLT
jgi:hypothetical protein